MRKPWEINPGSDFASFLEQRMKELWEKQYREELDKARCVQLAELMQQAPRWTIDLYPTDVTVESSPPTEVKLLTTDVKEVKLQHSKPYRVVLFDSVSEFSSERPRTENWMKIWQSVEGHLRDSPDEMEEWYGARSSEEVYSILEKGHKKYVELVRDNSFQVDPPAKLRPRPVQGDIGDEVCIHRINSGNLNTAWRRKSDKVKLGVKNIRLVANLGVSGFVGSASIKWRGVAALVVAEALISAGYNVAIDAFMGSQNITNKENCAFIVPIKHYETPLDVQSLSSTLCFPAFFRLSGFLNFGMCEGELASDYGQPTDDDILRSFLQQYYHDPSEFIEIIKNDTLNKDKSRKEISRILDAVSALNTPQKEAA